VPRWLAVLAVLTALAVLVGVVITHRPTAHGHAGLAAPSSTAPSGPPTPRGSVVSDVAMGAHSPWVLQRNALVSVGGPRVSRRLSLAGLHLTDGAPRLAVDAAAHRIWIVVTNAPTCRMIEYDERTLTKLRDITWRQLVQSAVAYRGHLYVQNDYGVADLAPGARQPHFIAGLGGAVGPLAVDLTRHRLIAMDLGYPTDLWTYRPGQLPVEAAQPLDINEGTVAVVDGAIWVAAYAGSGGRGAMLERLNPRTLRPMFRADARPFGSRAAIVGNGAHVLWVQPGTVGATLLACVGAQTGRVEQHWRLPNVAAVTSGQDGALAVASGAMLGLILDGCQG
jgi:hypothetical protein